LTTGDNLPGLHAELDGLARQSALDGFLRLRHLAEDACFGSISEVFDGDPPHRPGGCPAQAWSVAEVLRLYRMVSTD
jgi:glycogen debranching enzyme